MKAFLFLCLTVVFVVSTSVADSHAVSTNSSIKDIPLTGRYAISSVIGQDQKQSQSF